VDICGSIEQFSTLREKVFQQGEQKNYDLHGRRLAPSGVVVKEALGKHSGTDTYLRRYLVNRELRKPSFAEKYATNYSIWIVFAAESHFNVNYGISANPLLLMKTSKELLRFSGTRFADDMNATNRPLALMEGSELAPSASVPSLATDTRVVEGVQPVAAPWHVSRTNM